MDIGTVLQALAGANFENIFLLAGLAFVAIAVVGDISGKISPGKSGRIGSGALGAVLIAFGISMHFRPVGVEVKDLAISADQHKYVGACPASLNVAGIVHAIGSGTVIYAFEYEDGTWTKPDSIAFDKSDQKLVTTVWSVKKSVPKGWVRLVTLAPKPKMTSREEQVSITCAKGSSAKPAAAVLDPARDSVQIATVSPKAGTTVKRGQPFVFHLLVDYNLASADAAILSVSVAQMPAVSKNCQGSGGELTDAVEVPIVRGTHQAKLSLTWSGDTGEVTRGRIYGKGFLTFVPMFWASVHGSRGERIRMFGIAHPYCYSFGA